jgi:RNase H-like domain found in reverse transcriptase
MGTDGGRVRRARGSSPAAEGRRQPPLGAAGVLFQKIGPCTDPVLYDRKLLACVSGIRHFRFMLEGWRFTLYTDHKLLTFALSKAAEPWTPRQCRHLSYVAEFTSNIRHIAGLANVVVDTLSRPPQPATATPLLRASPPQQRLASGGRPTD